MEKCVNCQFYDRRNARPTDGRATMWGQCRKHSPLLNPINAKQYMVEGVWPLVRDDDWCGEWRSPTRAVMARPRFAGRGDTATVVAIAGETPSASPPPSAVVQEAQVVAVGDD